MTMNYVNPDPGGLRSWQDKRWHVFHPRQNMWKGIHAGEMLELKVDNKWVLVRVESKDNGRQLIAYLNHRFTSPITDSDLLRWPLEEWENR